MGHIGLKKEEDEASKRNLKNTNPTHPTSRINGSMHKKNNFGLMDSIRQDLPLPITPSSFYPLEGCHEKSVLSSIILRMKVHESSCHIG